MVILLLRVAFSCFSNLLILFAATVADDVSVTINKFGLLIIRYIIFVNINPITLLCVTLGKSNTFIRF